MKLTYAISLQLLLISILLCCFTITGCVAMGNRVDHSVQIINTGKSAATDVVYTYGELGARPIKNLGIGGGGVTKSMPIPEFIDVTWTSETDGKVHEVHVPLKSKVSARKIGGKIVSIEINGAVLEVYLETRLPDFKRDREKIY